MLALVVVVAAAVVVVAVAVAAVAAAAQAQVRCLALTQMLRPALVAWRQQPAQTYPPLLGHVQLLAVGSAVLVTP